MDRQPWEKAADQIAEFTLSGISRKLHGLELPSGSYEDFIKQACLDYAAQIEKKYSEDTLRQERDNLRAQNNQLRKALEIARLLVRGYLFTMGGTHADDILTQIESALEAK